MKVESTIVSAGGASADRLSSASRRPTAANSASSPSWPCSLSRQDPPQRPPEAAGGPDRPQGRRQHRPRPGDPAEDRVPRERPHPDDLHPGSVRGEGLPGEIDLRLRQGLEPAARQAAGGPGLPAELQPRTPRPGRLPGRPDPRRPRRAGSTRSAPGSATPSTSSPTHRSRSSSSPCRAARRACWSTTPSSARRRRGPRSPSTGRTARSRTPARVVKTDCGKERKAKK